ncbi:chemotaxis protein CheW [Undibacterium sp. Di24W]|uniref:chemotaxis protein CheW n=1 Tax=Undibacterium sp. Di24W TaxID=3413033 RepID=UPI003BF0040D
MQANLNVEKKEAPTGLALSETQKQSSTGQYLTFLLSGEVYALGILNIKEIIQYGDLTEVPMMPSFIRGVINLRGKVVPVVDLAVRFGKGETAVSRRTSIIIIEMMQTDIAGQFEAQSLGIMVDAVNEVIDIAAADIEPPPTFGAKLRPDFISGMAKQLGRFIILLNLETVLSIQELSSIGQSVHALGGEVEIGGN